MTARDLIRQIIRNSSFLVVFLSKSLTVRYYMQVASTLPSAELGTKMVGSVNIELVLTV